MLRTRMAALAVLCACIVMACPVTATAADPDGSQEYTLKAAFLLNFLKFTDWTRETAPSNSPCVVAVLGEDPFGPVLETTVADKTVRGRPIRVVRFANARSLTESDEQFHVLFVASPADRRMEEVLKAVGSRSALIVGETPDFCDRGGVIGFVTIENRLRFNVNLDAARLMGLKISSQMLKLANSVKSGVPEETSNAPAP